MIIVLVKMKMSSPLVKGIKSIYNALDCFCFVEYCLAVNTKRRTSSSYVCSLAELAVCVSEIINKTYLPQQMNLLFMFAENFEPDQRVAVKTKFYN